jgi:sugar/nucleoside kinase (ribokinase family)
VSALIAAVPRLVIKLGARGALCAERSPGVVQHEIQAPQVEPVDTTGAGDCFNAGLIAGLLRGLPLPRAAALGCAAGAASTQAPGGTGSPLDLAAALAYAETAGVIGPGSRPQSQSQPPRGAVGAPPRC